MSSEPKARATVRSSTPQKTDKQRSERDQEVEAYIRGEITVDEFLNTMDRHGSWIEQFMNRLVINPVPGKRSFIRRIQRAS